MIFFQGCDPENHLKTKTKTRFLNILAKEKFYFLLEKEGLTRQRQALEEALARLPDPETLAEDRKARAKALTRVPALTRDLAVGLVERILVSPRKEGTQEILLVWKF